MWASSWRKTILTRCSDHFGEPAGRTTRGRKAPHVIKTEAFLLSSRRTIFFKPYSLEIKSVSRLHGPFGIGTDKDTTRASRRKPVTKTITPITTPVAHNHRSICGNLRTMSDPADDSRVEVFSVVVSGTG